MSCFWIIYNYLCNTNNYYDSLPTVSDSDDDLFEELSD